MLDQSFSAHNFEFVFNIENRKGLLNKDRLSDDYKRITEELKGLKEIQKSFSRKPGKWSEDERNEYERSKQKIELLNSEREQTLKEDLERIAEKVNSRKFQFKLESKEIRGQKVYTIGEDNESFYAMKCLQHNIKRTFGVQTASRHNIMLQLKLLLNNNLPKYIIRTDISSFFESIPHSNLLAKIENNTLLSIKSRSFIKAVLKEYDNVKDNTFTKEKGIPRGVGISSFLSELYMSDIDKSIKKRPEVLYYARYVDDIFIILSQLPFKTKDLKEYYSELCSLFEKNELELKRKDDGKCTLVDFYTEYNKDEKASITYLGYNLELRKSPKNKKNQIQTTYNFSNKKIERIKSRTNKAVTRFEKQSKYNLKKARKELFTCLKLITGNVKLTNSKKGIKTGIFYNNDLIDKTDQLTVLNDYLKSKIQNIKPYNKLFDAQKEKDIYIKKLSESVKRFDFLENWKTKRIYNLSINEMAKIKNWLYEET